MLAIIHFLGENPMPEAIPRSYLRMAKRFGWRRWPPTSGRSRFNLKFEAAQGKVEAIVACTDGRKPRAVKLRVPHPQGRKATLVRRYL